MTDEVETHECADGIRELANTTVPRWLKVLYILLPVWGLFWLYTYWNGSSGVLDRGHWHELQQAAKTTMEQTK